MNVAAMPKIYHIVHADRLSSIIAADNGNLVGNHAGGNIKGNAPDGIVDISMADIMWINLEDATCATAGPF